MRQAGWKRLFQHWIAKPTFLPEPDAKVGSKPMLNSRHTDASTHTFHVANLALTSKRIDTGGRV